MRDAPETYIIEQFQKIFDVSARRIVVMFTPDETIDVTIRRHDTDITYLMEIGSDDDMFVFRSDDMPTTSFPILCDDE